MKTRMRHYKFFLSYVDLVAPTIFAQPDHVLPTLIRCIPVARAITCRSLLMIAPDRSIYKCTIFSGGSNEWKSDLIGILHFAVDLFPSTRYNSSAFLMAGKGRRFSFLERINEFQAWFGKHLWLDLDQSIAERGNFFMEK